MPKLILIKHAAPEVVPGVPSEKWQLSERGRASCGPLAELIRPHQPQVIVSSTEPKAIETAEIVAKQLELKAQTATDLHEHDRRNVPHMRSGEFISALELFFRRPDELVLGKETARDAEERIAGAIHNVLAANAGKNVAVVSHGTVIALFVALHSDRPAFKVWREMGLPSLVVMELPEFRILETIPKIE